MKTLQNNYTTPEQSKRLLELGVPADSADMWWEKDETIRINGEWVHGAAWGKVPNPFNWDRDNNRYYTYSDIKAAVTDFIGNETLPCWSVGRLMEIITMCHLSRDSRFCFREDMCECLVESICGFIKYGEMDFSELEGNK